MRFEDYLNGEDAGRRLETSELQGMVIPLFSQVIQAHERGRVAPLRGVEGISIKGSQLVLEMGELSEASSNEAGVVALEKHFESRAFDVVGELDRLVEAGSGAVAHRLRWVGEVDEDLAHPMYLTRYVSWEHRVDHHDPLTDIFSLGMLTASLACGLDFRRVDDLTRFVQQREDLMALNPKLHPVWCGAIKDMTELRRSRRPQDLARLVEWLENYRDQAVEVDFRLIKGFRLAEPKEKRGIILEHLRSRLFEISRRNRLIYFKPTSQTVNLTMASVPQVLDYRHVRPDRLLTWQGKFAERLSEGKGIRLDSYISFDEAPYLQNGLDMIIRSVRRDRAEYGVAQLRLVLAFLHWYDLKEAPKELIQSPLVLLPVELGKRRGVRDTYELIASTTLAEVNPILRQHLAQMYGLELPEALDLSETGIAALHEVMAKGIRNSEPGVRLELVDRPRIRLIHSQARQRVEAFRKRSRQSGRQVAQAEGFNLDFSYSRDRYEPLGVRLFERYVKRVALPWPELRDGQGNGSDGALEKEYFSFENGGRGNSFLWEINLCQVTLANFNYRKMSLVQDYNGLMENEVDNPVFEEIFSSQPRSLDRVGEGRAGFKERFPIVSMDPTQAAAIDFARTGKSYIIQGPPGTGKSQTITNLIADYVSRGKRVLFICAKRAAIDVVYYRLKQHGMDELCCLIHDSQTDKRGVIQDLKQSYEGFLAGAKELEASAKERDGVAEGMEMQVGQLDHIARCLTREVEGGGESVIGLIRRLCCPPEDLEKVESIQLEGEMLERLPTLAAWREGLPMIREWRERLVRAQIGEAWCRHPLRWLSPGWSALERPIPEIRASVARVKEGLSVMAKAVERVGGDRELFNAWEVWEPIWAWMDWLAPTVEKGHLDLLDSGSERSQDLERSRAQLKALRAGYKKAEKGNQFWQKRLSERELETALAQAKEVGTGVLRWLKPSFYRLKRVMEECYDFSAHTLPPTWLQVLEGLKEEYVAKEAWESYEREALERYRVPDLKSLDGFKELGKYPGKNEPCVKILWDFFSTHPNERDAWSAWLQARPAFAGLQAEAARCFRKGAAEGVWSWMAVAEGVEGRLEELTRILEVWRGVSGLDEAVQGVLVERDWDPEAVEWALMEKSFVDFAEADLKFKKWDHQRLSHCLSRIQEQYRAWLDLNSAWVRVQSRNVFRRHALTAQNRKAAGEADWVGAYRNGRRDLEHEFRKTMRYRSIRELATGDTGAVLKDLKPIWLMSPLSVSDALPLESTGFDVVIFDEASQIPIEEAIPALFRARQAIVVGDEMQLPPTQFFSSQGGEEEEDEALSWENDEGERVSYDLNANSLLSQAVLHLPSAMLGWHYRSRYESLISFSNASFYEGRLLTIPENRLPASCEEEWVVGEEADLVLCLDHALARGLDFHRVLGGVYEQRKNIREARYIAELVRELLVRKTGLTVGVVAFSEAQQGAIESALDELASEDGDFRSLLEEEWEREEEGQFCGLLVKNLENVQGDERDLMILSVCYGPDSQGKMRMNFGPINQRGGEKRLNVIITRAKRHMIVVSSIHGDAITNTYNYGANTLKQFLDYAAASASGRWDEVRRILKSRMGEREEDGGVSKMVGSASHPVVVGLGEELTRHGFEVEYDVGQSQFRCPLAVRDPGGLKYALGILVDTDEHFAVPDWLDRYYLRPNILKAFGWEVMFIQTKDWYERRENVVDRVKKQLASLSPKKASALEGADPEEES